MQAVDWTQLPSELLSKIAGSLDELADSFRFGAVCKPWLSASSRPAHLPRVRLPWIQLHKGSFYSLSDNRIYTFSLPQSIRGKTNLWSTHGCIFSFDFPSAAGFPSPSISITMLNPVTNDQILLPPLPPLGFKASGDIGPCKFFPSREPGKFVVMIAFPSRCSVACYKEKEWKEIQISGMTTNFTYHRGQYFVFRRYYENTTSIVCPNCIKTVENIPWVGNRWTEENHRGQYLVKSSSGVELYLLIVLSSSGRMRFEVFQLDQSEKTSKWSRVKNIGQDMIFVNIRHGWRLMDAVHDAFALPATGYFGGCRRNCIVFLDGEGGNDVTHFNLFDIETDAVELLRIKCDTKKWRKHIWYIPSTDVF